MIVSIAFLINFLVLANFTSLNTSLSLTHLNSVCSYDNLTDLVFDFARYTLTSLWIFLEFLYNYSDLCKPYRIKFI